MEQFVTAAVFTYPHEIQILKHLLQDAGISFYFQNETITSFAPLYAYALGGIQLKVHPNDLEAVNLILDNFNNNHLKIVWQFSTVIKYILFFFWNFKNLWWLLLPVDKCDNFFTEVHFWELYNFIQRYQQR